MRPAKQIGIFLLVLTSMTGNIARGAEPVATWPQWRGPQRDGRVAGESNWPEQLAGTALKQVWRNAMSPSYSGPIVSETMVFVTETVDKKREVVRALDRKTGRQIWEATWEGSLSVPFFAKENGDWIRATPAFDGESLYVAGIRDLLVCLNAATGDIRWTFNFPKEFKTPLPAFGFVCSPLVDGEFVYVQAGASFVCLDKQTGKVIWRSLKDDGGMWGSAFSSPIMANLAGRRQLLVQTREKLAGVEPTSGDVLWTQEIPAFRGMNILTPTPFENSVFTSAYGGMSHLFTIRASTSEITHSETWTNKARGYMSSPVVIDGHLYLHLQNQRFTCINLKTGESKWTTTPYGKYWSLVVNGDRILALDERGDLLLIRANPEKFELLDSRKVSDSPTWAHLAVCGREIFIRELNAMTKYEWK
mgnify:FL=1